MLEWRRMAAVTLLAALAIIGATGMAGRDSGGAINSALGRQLVLLDVRAGEPASLAALPVAVHAQIAQGGGLRLIASGEPNAVRATVSPTTILDADSTGKVYYFLDKHEPEAAALAAAWGRIVYEDDAVILLAVDATRERDFLEAVAVSGVHVELLTDQRLPPAPPPPLPRLFGASAPPVPAIAALLPQVTPEGLTQLLAEISGERSARIGGRDLTLSTRYTFSSQIDNAVQYTVDAFARLGLAPERVPWSYSRYRGVNVVADLRGRQNPERIWIVGAHLDDRSETPYARAPGGDDNASGMAALLTLADILSKQQFADTIRFVAFTGEEQGMWGSKSYAARLRGAGAQVLGFINLDMLGWDGNDDRVAEAHGGAQAASRTLAQAYADASVRYATGLTVEVKNETASRFSDHSPFWDNGFAAIMANENFFADQRPADRTPHYHKASDKLQTLRIDYTARIARTALATIAELAGMQSAAGPSPSPTATPSPSATGTPAAPSPTTTATATAAPVSPSPTPTAISPGCRDLIANGGMETAAAWSVGGTARPPAFVASPVASGLRSLRLGIEPATADRRSHSSAFQRFSIPRGSTNVVLSASLWRGSQDTSGDYQEIVLLTSQMRVMRVLQRGLANDAAWQTARHDLTSYAGRDLSLYVNVYSDGDGRRSWMYADDVQIIACAP